MRAKALSWKTENTTSGIPTASPSFPVVGAGMNDATSTRTRIMLTRMVDEYWSAFAALTVETAV